MNQQVLMNDNSCK